MTVHIINSATLKAPDSRLHTSSRYHGHVVQVQVQVIIPLGFQTVKRSKEFLSLMRASPLGTTKIHICVTPRHPGYLTPFHNVPLSSMVRASMLFFLFTLLKIILRQDTSLRPLPSFTEAVHSLDHRIPIDTLFIMYIPVPSLFFFL